MLALKFIFNYGKPDNYLPRGAIHKLSSYSNVFKFVRHRIFLLAITHYQCLPVYSRNLQELVNYTKAAI